MPLYPAQVQTNYSAITAPTINDDVTKGYVVGSTWVDTVSGFTYVCVNNTQGAAVWNQDGITQAGASAQGAKGYVQFRGNNAGTFDASANLQWDNNVNSLQVGLPAVGGLANSLQTNVLNTNSYIQTVVQNLSSGTQASGDFIVTADNGTDSAFYLDMGMNGSGYSDPGLPLSLANDGYIYAQDGSLTIGTNSTNKYLLLHTGGFGLDKERLRITDAALAKDAAIKLKAHLELLPDTTANRPTTPVNGTVRYNTTTSRFEGYQDNSWVNMVIPTPVPISDGGTGQTTQQTAINALLPTQSGNSGLFLKTDGTNVLWAAAAGTGSIETDFQIANATVTATTTSLTPVDMPGMTLTTSNTANRNYLILFTCTFAQAKQSQLNYFSLVVDGATVTTRPLLNFTSGSTTTSPQVCHMQWLVNLPTAKIIKVQFWTVSGQGVLLEVANRNLIIRGV